MEKNKVSIRIHTMLDRVKIYEADNYFESDDKLIIYGHNVLSKIRGKFVYPLHSIEHYNIVDDNDYLV